MRHWAAVREVRRNYTRRGTYLWLRRYGFWRFVRHPSDAHALAARLTDGAFS